MATKRSADEKFAALEAEFCDGWLKRRPLDAFEFGMLEVATVLPEASRKSYEDDIKFLEKYAKKFAAYKEKKGLSPERVVDLELAKTLIKRWLFELTDLRMWEKRPDMGTLVGRALHQIFVNDQMSTKEKCQAIEKRLADIEGFAARCMSRLTAPPQLWVDMELETMTRLPAFFNTIKSAGRISMSNAGFDRLHAVLERTEDALDSYSEFMIEQSLPKATFELGVGESLFTKYMKVRDVGMGPKQLVNFGKKHLYALQRKFKRLAAQTKKSATILEIRGMVKVSHPNSVEEAMTFTRNTLKKLRAFLDEKDVVTLPKKEEIKVEQMPVFRRQVFPFGSYLAPQPGTPKQKLIGHYQVTPGELRNERLREHNFASLTSMAVHEGYPGRHLAAIALVRNESRLRKLADTPETTWGWGHYCEELIVDLGFQDSPQNQMMHLLNQIWRTSQVILDVELHCGRYDLEQATWFLLDETGMERQAAEIEIRRYTQDPGGPLSFMLGKDFIQKLAADMKKKMGRSWSQRVFHDAVLAAGPLPFKLLKKDVEWRVDAWMTEQAESPDEAEASSSKAKKAAKATKTPAAKKSTKKAAPKKATRKKAAPKKAASKKTAK